MSEKHFTRRDFARHVALGHIALGSGVAVVAASARADGDETPDETTEETPAQDEAPAPPTPKAEDFALAALLLRYPSEHLTDEMLAGIRSGLKRSERQAKRIRSVPLENSDEPAIVFRAFRKD